MTTSSFSRQPAMQASMGSFVLLWGSAALFTHWGLDYVSAVLLLVLRFAIALLVLVPLCMQRERWLPPRGMRMHVALTGALLIGGYSLCYFMAMDKGVTPGVLATLLGVQPILTLLAVERRFSLRRLGGLLLSLAGLAAVVLGGADSLQTPWAGMCFALGALVCMTLGTIAQKRVALPPLDTMPLQYCVGMVIFLLALPLQTPRAELVLSFAVPLVWLGVAISVVAQLLFYRMIHSGNLVNVTSLFYLVPIVTAILDYLLLGHRLSNAGLAGMVAILVGLALVFRKKG